MKYLLIAITTIFFIGCGVVEYKDTTSNIYTYDFWDYRTPDNNISKGYNQLIYTNGVLSNVSYFTYRYDEVIQDQDTIIVNDNITITKYGSYIDNNGTIEERFVKIGDEYKDGCNIHKHYNIYTINDNVSFYDVLQTKCDNVYINYSKEFGNVGFVVVDGNNTIVSYYDDNLIQTINNDLY